MISQCAIEKYVTDIFKINDLNLLLQNCYKIKSLTVGEKSDNVTLREHNFAKKNHLR